MARPKKAMDRASFLQAVQKKLQKVRRDFTLEEQYLTTAVGERKELLVTIKNGGSSQ